MLVWQLKKALEDLSELMAEKDELAQRCQELDIQVRNSITGITGKDKHVIMMLLVLSAQ